MSITCYIMLCTNVLLNPYKIYQVLVHTVYIFDYNKLCEWRHNMPPPLQVDNIFAFIRQVAVLFRHNNIFVFISQVAPVLACWLFKASATS